MPMARFTHSRAVPASLAHRHAKLRPVNIDKSCPSERSRVSFPTLRRVRWQAAALVAALLAPVLAILLSATLPVANADDWLPISPEELKMTSEPKAPGAPAINLYRQVDRDDQAY